MAFSRYKKLRQHLHCSNNSQPIEIEKNNKLFKTEPYLTHIHDNCLKLEPEEHH